MSPPIHPSAACSWAALAPASLTAILLIIVAIFISRKRGYKGNGRKFSLKHVGEAFVPAIWAILVPVIILGGIYGGIFTPTEAAAVAVIYGFFAGKFIYKELTWKSSWTLSPTPARPWEAF